MKPAFVKAGLETRFKHTSSELLHQNSKPKNTWGESCDLMPVISKLWDDKPHFNGVLPYSEMFMGFQRWLFWSCWVLISRGTQSFPLCPNQLSYFSLSIIVISQADLVEVLSVLFYFSVRFHFVWKLVSPSCCRAISLVWTCHWKVICQSKSWADFACVFAGIL